MEMWRLDPKHYTLTLGKPHYEIDLERCRTSAECLDWIMQVATKRWATDEILAALVRTLNRILKPQQYIRDYILDKPSDLLLSYHLYKRWRYGNESPQSEVFAR